MPGRSSRQAPAEAVLNSAPAGEIQTQPARGSVGAHASALIAIHICIRRRAPTARLYTSMGQRPMNGSGKSLRAEGPPYGLARRSLRDGSGSSAIGCLVLAVPSFSPDWLASKSRARGWCFIRGGVVHVRLCRTCQSGDWRSQEKLSGPFAAGRPPGFYPEAYEAFRWASRLRGPGFKRRTSESKS